MTDNYHYAANQVHVAKIFTINPFDTKPSSHDFFFYKPARLSSTWISTKTNPNRCYNFIEPVLHEHMGDFMQNYYY